MPGTHVPTGGSDVRKLPRTNPTILVAERRCAPPQCERAFEEDGAVAVHPSTLGHGQHEVARSKATFRSIHARVLRPYRREIDRFVRCHVAADHQSSWCVFFVAIRNGPIRRQRRMCEVPCSCCRGTSTLVCFPVTKVYPLRAMDKNGSNRTGFGSAFPFGSRWFLPDQAFPSRPDCFSFPNRTVASFRI